MQSKDKIIILTVGIAAALVGGLVGGSTGERSVDITVETDPQKLLGWEKPQTDEAWARDVKLENFDIKSETVLEEMITSHDAKRVKIQAELDEWLACQECIYYPILKQMNGDKAAATEEFRSQLQQKVWDVEKLTQSVERMRKELDLRERGVVTANVKKDGKKLTASELKQIPADKLRIIND
jgi:hypothetical protein